MADIPIMTVARFLWGLLQIIVLLLAPASRALSFTVPEKLIFDLTWSGIKAGTATLETIPGGDVVRIVSTTRSASWVSVFYTVEDRIESVLESSSSSGPGAPKQYRVKIREGKHRRDKEVVFDRAHRKALFVDHLTGETGEVPLAAPAFDPLSSLYYVRSLRLEPERSAFVDVLDIKKLWTVEVRVLRREKITTTLGSFDTIVIKPLMKSEGIFNRKGELYIWLTEDSRRLPVKMQTKVAVGSITATLAGVTY